MSSKALCLRPHHGMCLRYFSGKGYSETFTAQMAQIQKALTPEALVELVSGTDAVCAACPNNQNGVCRTQEQVDRYDREVLNRCGLHAGQRLSYGSFSGLVEARILAPGLRPAVCGDCEWSDLCGGGGTPFLKNKK